MSQDAFISVLSRYRSRNSRLRRPTAHRVRREMQNSFVVSSNKGDIVRLDDAIAQDQDCPECGAHGLHAEHYYHKKVRAAFIISMVLFMLALSITSSFWYALPFVFIAWHVGRDLPFAGSYLAVCMNCNCAWPFKHGKIMETA